jgi:PAS domain S-box-containing protein
MYATYKIRDSFIRHLLNNFSEGIVVLNSSHEIIYINDFITKITGYDSVELIGVPLERLFPENADEIKSTFVFGDIPSTIKFYKRIQRKNNSSFTAKIRLSKETDKEGILHFIIYVKDNSDYQNERKDILRKVLTIEQLSKSRKIRNGKLKEAIFEILESASRAIHAERLNAWVFNEDKSKIHCIGNYDTSKHKMDILGDLSRTLLPNYFRLFESEKVIITVDAFNSPKTSELVDIYLKPNNIHSLMDIPIRVEGEMIGVLCFENKDTPREWTIEEQKFGLVIAQLISLAIETNEKKIAHAKTETALREQKVLLQEVQHRVKNNLAIISSLINLQATKAKDKYHRELFQESKNRLESIAKVHSLLYQSQSYSSVNLKNYFNEILDNLTESFSGINKQIKIKKDIDDIVIDVSSAITLALILNELVTNSYKHAFNDMDKGQISVSLKEKKGKIYLKVKDSGSGYPKQSQEKSSLGLHIIEGLVEQIDATLTHTNSEGAISELHFVKPVF